MADSDTTGPSPPAMQVMGFVGWSGEGKTALLARLIPVLVGQGLRVSTIKHTHHDFDIDHPGKDSHTHRMAGASEVLVASPHRWALLHELRGAAEPSVEASLARLSPADLVLIEGFKTMRYPKIEVHRPAIGKPMLQPHDSRIVAVASDVALALAVPVLPLDDIAAIAAFVRAHAAPAPTLAGVGAV